LDDGADSGDILYGNMFDAYNDLDIINKINYGEFSFDEIPSELKESGSLRVEGINLVGLLRLTWGGMLQMQREIERLTGTTIPSPSEQLNQQQNDDNKSYMRRLLRRLRRLWRRE
jgi:hypothetical protein